MTLSAELVTTPFVMNTTLPAGLITMPKGTCRRPDVIPEAVVHEEIVVPDTVHCVMVLIFSLTTNRKVEDGFNAMLRGPSNPDAALAQLTNKLSELMSQDSRLLLLFSVINATDPLINKILVGVFRNTLEAVLQESATMPSALTEHDVI